MKSLHATFLFVLAYSAFGQPYNFNQNIHFGQKIEEGKWMFEDEYSPLEMVMKKEELSQKDFQGNKMYRLHFTSEKKEFYLVPDNPFYPLLYQLMAKKNDKRGIEPIESDIGYLVLNENHISAVRINYKSAALKDDKIKANRIAIYPSNLITLTGKVDGKFAFKSFYRKKGTGTPYKNWIAFSEAHKIKVKYSSSGGVPATQYPGIPTFYNYFKKYQENQIEIAKSKNVQALLSEFKDGEYTVIGSNLDNLERGKVNLSFRKKGNQILGFKAQNIFTDGQYYDKEKFFSNWTFTKDGKMTNGNKTFNVIPFDGRLIVYYTTSRGSFNQVWAVITPKKFDMLGYRLSKSKFWAVKNTDNLYYCKQELEPKYDADKDLLRLYFYFEKYIKTLMKI